MSMFIADTRKIALLSGAGSNQEGSRIIRMMEQTGDLFLLRVGDDFQNSRTEIAKAKLDLPFSADLLLQPGMIRQIDDLIHLRLPAAVSQINPVPLLQVYSHFQRSLGKVRQQTEEENVRLSAGCKEFLAQRVQDNMLTQLIVQQFIGSHWP